MFYNVNKDGDNANNEMNTFVYNNEMDFLKIGRKVKEVDFEMLEYSVWGSDENICYNGEVAHA